MNPDDPAFPIVHPQGGIEAGLTNRELLAALALVGILASHTDEMPLPKPECAARDACAYADALLAAQ